jgi:twinkle protein
VAFYGVVEDTITYAYPYFRAGENVPCFFKIRGKESKTFRSTGDSEGIMMFGQQAIEGKRSKRVIVVEGENDAIAARQGLKSKEQYDEHVVSLSGGAGSVRKDLQASYTFLDSYDEIILAFDADEQGRKATADMCDVFAGKIKVMQFDPAIGKDANDYVMAGKTDELKRLMWDAKPFTPEGVLSSSDLWERLSRERPESLGDYPWPPLNKLTYGFRPTELVTICAGSGLGKSSILREIVMHIKQTTDNKIGCLFMEESVERTAEGFMGVDLSFPIHLPTSPVKYGDAAYKDSFDRTFGDDQLFIMDASFDTGATVDQVVSRVRFMAKAMDCKVIILDHISILVSGGQYGDERRALDEIMTKLRTLTQDTGIVLFAVSHLKRPDGKGHEEGAVTSVAQLRGSASIAQLSDFVIGLERNGQAEDETERNTTHIRVLKNRFSGITGPAGHLLYSADTGRLTDFEPVVAEEEAL